MYKVLATAFAPAPRLFQDGILLAWRCAVGSFLIWGVGDNILSSSHMAGFVAFLGAHGFPYPELLGPLSVWAQFLCGLCFIVGFATRYAGLVCAINFAVAVAMVDAKLGIRSAVPASMLMMFGLYLAARGAGAMSVDAWLARLPTRERSCDVRR